MFSIVVLAIAEKWTGCSNTLVGALTHLYMGWLDCRDCSNLGNCLGAVIQADYPGTLTSGSHRKVNTL